MPSLRCDHCKKLFEYRAEIIALREALKKTELEAGTVEGVFEPVGKFHVSCYEAIRSEAPDDWPELAASSR